MKPAAAVLAPFALVAACSGHHVESAGPAGLPYACADGRAARIYYEGAGERARARLVFDGRTFKMEATPAMSGLLYVSQKGLAPGPGLIWSAEGDEARLSESATDGAGVAEEQEIVRCSRIREEHADTPPSGATPDDHH